MVHTDIGNFRHFHIFWQSKNAFDWEVFDSYDGAVVSALRIALPGEMFSIKCFSTECQACKTELTTGAKLQISTGPQATKPSI